MAQAVGFTRSDAARVAAAVRAHEARATPRGRQNTKGEYMPPGEGGGTAAVDIYGGMFVATAQLNPGAGNSKLQLTGVMPFNGLVVSTGTITVSSGSAGDYVGTMSGSVDWQGSSGQDQTAVQFFVNGSAYPSYPNRLIGFDIPQGFVSFSWSAIVTLSDGDTVEMWAGGPSTAPFIFNNPMLHVQRLLGS